MSRFLILVCFAVALVQQQQPNDKNLRDQGQKDTQSTQGQTGTSTSRRGTQNGTDQKAAGDENKGQNQAVNVTVAPEISSDKAITDWIIALCTIVLTVVGIIGTRAAIKTLKAIEKQADYMRVHADHFEKLAKATADQLTEMQQSRDIQTKTLILQYRPKIIVRDARAFDFNVAELGEPAKARIKFDIINAGGSMAHIADGWIALWSGLSSTAKIDIRHGKDAMLGKFDLEPGENTAFETVLDIGVTNDLQWANYHEGVRDGAIRSIYLVGMIRYFDDLGIPRRTGVNRNYDPKTQSFIASGAEGEYTD